MYMQEALEMVCRRRRLQAKEYALLLSDMSIIIPLDRTVASLQGKSELMLVKRTMLPHLNVDVRPIGRSTDPNGTFPPFLPGVDEVFCSDRIVVKQRRSSSACPTHQISTLVLRRISPLHTRSVFIQDLIVISLNCPPPRARRYGRNTPCTERCR